ncbi:hypothetical protein [Limosilactobacillus vaginalis]|uniref:hypothetical protein n=1 Tax=Limosilactobacillus vaginalis TaxID=1633 RepID=UPI003AB47D5A
MKNKVETSKHSISKGFIAKTNNKLEDLSSMSQPFMKMAIIVSLIASFLTPLLFYLYGTYKYILKNDYVYLGILMLLIPVMLEILFSLGIKEKLLPGLIFACLYFITILFLMNKNPDPLISAISLVFLGYLSSYILVKGIIIFVEELTQFFSKVENTVILLGKIMVPILSTLIPIAIAFAIKQLFK